jgi:cyanamide hydratase
MAILKQQFPTNPLSPSTMALTALLHDIGHSHLRATQLSFEFYGGFLSLNLLRDQLHASQSQAEAVAEAIIRHQDIGTVGKISFLGQLIQLATLYDNGGQNPELVSKETRDDVNREFPRRGWAQCFSSSIREENSLKPWAHTTKCGEEEFPNMLLENDLMNGYA